MILNYNKEKLILLANNPVLSVQSTSHITFSLSLGLRTQSQSACGAGLVSLTTPGPLYRSASFQSSPTSEVYGLTVEGSSSAMLVEKLTTMKELSSICRRQNFPSNFQPPEINTQNSGAPTLADGVNEEFLEVILGCSSGQGEPTPPTIVEPEFRSQFELSSLTKISQTALSLSPEYNIVTNQDIVFHIEVEAKHRFEDDYEEDFSQACLPEDDSQCTSVTVTLSYTFNSGRPQFNDIAGEATVRDAEACSEQNPQENENCQVEFIKPFFATDSDGDLVTYQIIPPSHVFDIKDNKDLSTLYYRGTGISQESSIPLLIQVKPVLVCHIYTLQSGGRHKELG